MACGGGGGGGNSNSYGAPQRLNNLRTRTSSFDSGDDATYFDGGTGVAHRQSIHGPEELLYEQAHSPTMEQPNNRRNSMAAQSNSSINRSQSQSGYFAVTPGGNGYNHPYSPAFPADTSYQNPAAAGGAPYPTTPGGAYNGNQQQSYNPAAYQQQRLPGNYPNNEYLPQRHVSTTGYPPTNSGQFSPTTGTYNPSTFTAPYPTYRPSGAPAASHPGGAPFVYSQYATRPQYATTSQSLYGQGQQYSPGLPHPPQSAPPHNSYQPPPPPPPLPHPPTSPGYPPSSYGSFNSVGYQPQNKLYLTRPETHYNSGSDSDLSPCEGGHPLPIPPKPQDRLTALQGTGGYNQYPGSNPLPSPPPPTPPSHGSFRRQQSQQGFGTLPPVPDDERHPQSRPLPYTPNNGLQQLEDEAAEELYDEVEGELKNMLQHKQSIASRHTSQQFEHEGEGSRPAPLFATGGRLPYPQNGTTMNGHPGVGQTVYGYYSNESDAEAAAGLEAMRLDEMQENQDNLDRERRDQLPTSGEHIDVESDGDYYGQDFGGLLGFYGATTYGEDDNIPVLNNNNVSPNRHSDIARMDSNASAASRSTVPPIYDPFAIPDDIDVHPFPEFQNARVDTAGTGGLAKPTPHVRKMSFDEGEEDINRSGSQSPSKHQSDSDGSFIPELFYHPPPSMGGPQPGPNTRPLPNPPDYDNMSELAGSGYGQLPYPDPGSPVHRRGLPLSGAPRLSMSTRQYATPVSADGVVSSVPNLGLGPQFPRSTSLNSHTSTPPTIAPIRSKTDGKAHPTRPQNRNSIHAGAGAPGIGADSEGLTLNDLPPIPMTKRFDPKKLSSRDFKRCERPWALSAIKAWLTEMTEGEQDLKEGAVADGIVALFTHFVPTMNVADAETLAVKVVAGMLKEKALVKDEEWVKFGEGDVSGVIYQITGNGCYAPKLHDVESQGRCYAHHCARTLRKITLSQNPEEQQKKEDWATFWKLKKDDLVDFSKKEVERQNNLHEIVQTEDEYMEHLRVLKSLYRDTIANSQPPIIKPTRLDQFVRDVFGAADAVRKVSEEHLLPQLKFRQREQGPWIVGFSDIFREWIRKAKGAYLAYAAAFPKADMLVRRESDRNIIFRQFLDQCRQDPRSRRLDWVTFLKGPITRLQRYGLLLVTVLKHTVPESEEKDNLQRAIEEIKQVTLECDSKVDEMSKSVALQELGLKLMMRQWDVDLMLEEKGRELVFKGDLQRNGNNRFTWLETHAILFDHYLVLAKTTMQRDANGGTKHERYDVSRMVRAFGWTEIEDGFVTLIPLQQPIPMDLLVLESTNDDPVVRNTANRLGLSGPTAAATVKTNPGPQGRHNTISSPGPGDLKHSSTGMSAMSAATAPGRLVTALPDQSRDDGRVMYPFRIKHLGNPSRSLKADDNTYTLYAPSAQNRKDWCDKIIQAKERHASSLHAQNAEPFRLKVMADTAFGYETTAASGPKPIVVRGTPLDRAIEEVEKMFQQAGPKPPVICRASVNCATAFTVQFGKEMVAIGTDYGVFTADSKNPRGWQRAINISRVTQIAVLEEFSLFLVLADKSLIAYHLDTVVPPPGTTTDAATKQRPPQKLSGGRDVGFFATGRMKERSLVFYKKREGLTSTFKVLEPVFPKAPEKKSRFSRKGATEFFRDYADFYIPTDCYGINLFHSSLAIQTSKGFEVMTLDKKQPWSVPELRASHVGDIATRLQGQKPLGMFRLSEIEFLLCYEECGVYVNKHGDVSRGVIMEFVGKAKTVAIYGPYILVFDNDFVEIRNAENGRLRQVIAGRDCRCIDDAQSGGSAGTRAIKVAMAHPEIEDRQLVVELLLNDGQRD